MEKNKAALAPQIAQIKNETIEKANTAQRVGQMLEDLKDSMMSIQDNLSSLLNGNSTTKALTEAGGKQLKDLIDGLDNAVSDVIAQNIAINLVLESNDINLDEFQEIVDAINSLLLSIQGKVSKSPYSNLSYSSTINISLIEENQKNKTTLGGNFTYNISAISSGSSLEHKINTGLITSPITITLHNAYTHRDNKGAPISQINIPAGSNKNYVIVLKEVDGEIAVAVLWLPGEESTGGGTTNLSTVYGASTVTIESDTGTDAAINPVTAVDPGIVSVEQFEKWEGYEDLISDRLKIQNWATAPYNVSGTTTLDYQNEPNPRIKYAATSAGTNILLDNVPPDSELLLKVVFGASTTAHTLTLGTTIDGIAVTNTVGGVPASTLPLTGVANSVHFINVFHDGTNVEWVYEGSSGETTTTIGALINGATAKTTPVDADLFGLVDSAASNILKKLTWANVKATLKSYFDTLYQAVLVSGTNIKTINGSSILGSGDLVVSGGGSALTVRDEGTSQGTSITEINFTGGGITANGSGGVVTVNVPTPGSVSSVGVTAPTGFSVSGSPVTTSGTIAITENTQSANLLKAGPASGSAAAPSYRALVAADIAANLLSLDKLVQAPANTVPGNISGSAANHSPVPVVSLDSVTYKKEFSSTWSGTTATIDASATVWVFTGSSATVASLLPISGNKDLKFKVYNRGSANITLQRVGTDNIYDGTNGTVTSKTITPGQVFEVNNDGTYWLIS
jgi:hypothetical protein